MSNDPEGLDAEPMIMPDGSVLYPHWTYDPFGRLIPEMAVIYWDIQSRRDDNADRTRRP